MPEPDSAGHDSFDASFEKADLVIECKLVSSGNVDVRIDASTDTTMPSGLGSTNISAAGSTTTQITAGLLQLEPGGEDVFFNDIDDVEMELKPEPPAPPPTTPGGGAGSGGAGPQPGVTPPKPTGPDDPFTPKQPRVRPGKPPPAPRPPVTPRDIAKKAPPKMKVKVRYTWPKKPRPAPRSGSSR